MNIKGLGSKTGVTLIEAMMVLSVGAIATTTTLKMTTDSEKSATVDLLSAQINKIVEGVDQRLTIDRYSSNLWPTIKDYNTRQQVSDFINKELIAHEASGCGNPDGWKPLIEDTEDEYRNKLKLIPCGLWNNNIPLDLDAEMHLKSTGNFISEIYTVLKFKDDEGFKDNYISLKQVLLKSRSSNKEGEAGFHQFKFIDLTSTTPEDSNLSFSECTSLKTKCGFYAGVVSSGEGIERIHVDGSNSMVNSKLTFQKDLNTPLIEGCVSYSYDMSLGWQKKENVSCGIGIDPTYNTPFVEINAFSSTFDKVFLKNECELNNGTKKPCGLYIDDSGAEEVLLAVDNLDVDYAEINVLNVTTATIEDLEVLTQLIANKANINTLEVSGVAKLKNTTTMEGIDNKVTNDFTVEGHSEIELLTVKGISTFKEDVYAEKDMTVNGTLSANNYKLGVITVSDLGTTCAEKEQGALKIFVNGQHTELVVCADIGTGFKWKLANARKNQVIAFKGACPEGYEDFEEGEGRFLVGATKGNVVTNGVVDYDSNGNPVSYSVGDMGGHSYVALTEAELPSHSHTIPSIETSCSGDSCQAANVKAGVDTVWSTTKELSTGQTGQNAPHENRPSYYAVNYCIFKG